MSSRRQVLAFAFALIGLAFSIAATYVHYRLLTQPEYVSPCDISARFSCSELYLSRYGSWHGMPVALGGVLLFGTVAVLAATETHSRTEEGRGGLVLALATVGLVAVAYFGSISFLVLRSGCVLCIGTYVAAAGLFAAAAAPPIASFNFFGSVAADIRQLRGRPSRVAAVVLWVAVVVAIAVAFPNHPRAETAATRPPADVSAATDVSPDEQRFDDVWARQPRIDLGIPAEGAKVVIVKFNDWQCPSCKAMHFAYKPILDKYAQSMPGAVKYVIKDFPLNRRCNFANSDEKHPAACEAAAAVRLGREKGKADELIDWLFANQESLSPASVAAKTKEMLGVEDFAAEYARVLPDIKRDVSDGASLHFRGTPTYYVNGVKAHGENDAFIGPQYFDYAIRYELRKNER